MASHEALDSANVTFKNSTVLGDSRVKVWINGADFTTMFGLFKTYQQEIANAQKFNVPFTSKYNVWRSLGRKMALITVQNYDAIQTTNEQASYTRLILGLVLGCVALIAISILAYKLVM